MPDDRRHNRLKRRHRKSIRHANHDREHDDHPRSNLPGHQQRDDRDRAQQLDRLEQRDHASSIEAIGQRAAEQRQQPGRRGRREGIEPDEKRRCAEREQEPRLRDLLGPRADARQQTGEPEGPKTARSEQLERSAKGPGTRCDVRLPNRGSAHLSLTLHLAQYYPGSRDGDFPGGSCRPRRRRYGLKPPRPGPHTLL